MLKFKNGVKSIEWFYIQRKLHLKSNVGKNNNFTNMYISPNQTKRPNSGVLHGLFISCTMILIAQPKGKIPFKCPATHFPKSPEDTVSLSKVFVAQIIEIMSFFRLSYTIIYKIRLIASYCHLHPHLPNKNLRDQSTNHTNPLKQS